MADAGREEGWLDRVRWRIRGWNLLAVLDGTGFVNRHGLRFEVISLPGERERFRLVAGPRKGFEVIVPEQDDRLGLNMPQGAEDTSGWAAWLRLMIRLSGFDVRLIDLLVDNPDVFGDSAQMIFWVMQSSVVKDFPADSDAQGAAVLERCKPAVSEMLEAAGMGPVVCVEVQVPGRGPEETAVFWLFLKGGVPMCHEMALIRDPDARLLDLHTYVWDFPVRDSMVRMLGGEGAGLVKDPQARGWLYSHLGEEFMNEVLFEVSLTQ